MAFGKSAPLPEPLAQGAIAAFGKLQKGMANNSPVFLPRLGASEKAILVGANLKMGGTKFHAGFGPGLSRNDVLNPFGSGGRPISPLVPFTGQDFYNLKQGHYPSSIPIPPPMFGFVRPPVVPPPVYMTPGYLPQPLAGGVAFAPSIDWDYWDGRCSYDHSYASSLFVSVGHTSYDGFDGTLVGGRYFAFGYGYLDGCINYGSGRVWVPGFYAPQPVTECQPVPVWVPPVYEDVWTGCCWETLQVDGGYFGDAPVDECHTVTRYVWVPGHYEYYYA